MDNDSAAPREPIFNLPGVIAALIAAFVGIHALRALVLSPDADFELLLYFSFLPLRYLSSAEIGGTVPGGDGARIWTFVTYAFLHGGLAHLVVNSLWMAVFGSAVARRFGTARFLAFSAATAAAGAALHLALHFGEPVPVVGASAAISGQMAAAARFVFAFSGPLGFGARSDPETYRQPALPLWAALANYRVLTFLGVWLALNLLFGLGSLPGQEGQSIAWEAHIGGFVAGLALFALFDPIPPR